MKKIAFFALMLFTAFANAQTVPSVAILDFDTRGYSAVDRRQIIEKLSLELINLEGYEVMDKYDIEYISTRDEVNFTGCFSRICLKELGEHLGVDYILTGSMDLLGEKVSTTVRLFDVHNGRFTQSTNRNYVDVPKNDLLMAELTLKEMFNMPVDEQLVMRVTSTNDYENLLNDMSDRILVAEGPRMGFGFVTGEAARILREDPENGGFGQALPMSSQFGYQFEKAYITTGNFQALAEVIPMVSGLENNRFMPTITILNGLRSNTYGWEFAFGPIVELSKTLDGQLDSRGIYTISSALVFSVGKTIKSGEMNFPINAYLIPPKSENSWRFGLSMGWNAAKKKRLLDY